MQTLNAPSLELCQPPRHGYGLAPQDVLLLQKTVLLAEDDNDLRYVMECILNTMGYLVIPCADAEIASSAFESQRVDALLTDFNMPGRSGMELARELTGASPDLPVMIITGSILSGPELQEIEDRNWIYVSKPCHLQRLEATLKEIMPAKAPAAASMSERAASVGAAA